MDNNSVVKILSSLAQDARLRIFRLLVQAGSAGLPAGLIGEKLEIPNSTLSFHLKELSHSGLIMSRQESRFVYYFANYEVMNGVIAYMTENCCAGLQECNSEMKCCN